MLVISQPLSYILTPYFAQNRRKQLNCLGNCWVLIAWCVCVRFVEIRLILWNLFLCPCQVFDRPQLLIDLPSHLLQPTNKFKAYQFARLLQTVSFQLSVNLAVNDIFDCLARFHSRLLSDTAFIFYRFLLEFTGLHHTQAKVFVPRSNLQKLFASSQFFICLLHLNKRAELENRCFALR